MQTGIVLEWYKSVGDAVTKGEPVCSIEGDKATVDVEAPTSGTLKKIVAKEGEEFPVKQAMAFIGEVDDVVDIDSTAESATIGTPIKPQVKRKEEFKQNKLDERIKASPVAKRLAKDNDIDLSNDQRIH